MADFGLHMLVVNNSSYAVNISYDADEGGDASNTGNLFAGDKSSIMNAKYDDGIVFGIGEDGAEGTFIFKMKEGPWQEPIITVEASCPTDGDDPNTADIKQTNQFFQIHSIRYANDPDGMNGDPNWGSDTVPQRGHPLSIQVILEDAPGKEILTVLTYNTHLFEGSPADNVGSHFHDRPVVYKDDERAKGIVNKIKSLANNNQPDIVCFEEVWSNDMRKTILDALQDTFSFAYLVPDEGSSSLENAGVGAGAGAAGGAAVGAFFFGIGAIPGAAIGAGIGAIGGYFGGAADAITNTSGLLLVSRYPLTNFDFTMYDDVSGDDSFAKKGICTCDVTIPVARGPYTIRLGFTHAPTDRAEALNAIRQAAQQTMGDPSMDRILAGDFNLVFKGPNYGELSEIMNQFDAHDLVDILHEESYTNDQNSPLAKIFFDPHDIQQRIDYIYFAPGEGRSCLEPASAEIPHDWNFWDDDKGENMPLSDHEPVLVTFDIKC